MFKAIGHLFGFIWDLTVAAFGGNPAPLVAHYVDPTPAPAAAGAINAITQEKKNLTPNGESIIGLKDPSLTINATGTLTTTTFDTTTYGDRAIIKLTNATGASIDLTGMCIKGKPVMQLAGQNGYVWEYSDYDSIEKEGEQFVEVSNDFIFDPVQAKQIGDFVWKELKPHKLYSLMLVGCQYQYEIGDVYHLTLEHTMNGGTMENIDTDVEAMGVSINRSVGGVGMTNLNLRVPSEAWALTLAKNSKLVGAGNAQRLNNRSNIVTVAASTWTGQADYFCDGADDNVEIQAAIDYLSSIGGGELILTSGYFNAGVDLLLHSGISLIGNSGTVINDTGELSIINYGSSISYSTISSIRFEMSGSNTGNAIFIYCSDCIFSNIVINYPNSTTGIACFTISGSNNSVISVNIISSSSSIGIRVGGSYNTINSCSLRNCKWGIDISNQYNKVSACSFDSCAIGILMFSVSSSVASSNSITNSSTGIAISALTPGNSNNNTVTGNFITGGSYGISISSRCENNVITGNRATGASVANFSDSGVGTINSGNSFV